MFNNPDVLYTQGSAAVWSAVEINIGILCNCLAMLKPFVRRHMPWLKSLIGVRSSSGAGSGGYALDRAHNKAGGTGGDAAGASHRERRKSGGMYELHSYGRDRGFGDGVGGGVGGVVVQGGLRGSSVDDGSSQDDGHRQGGILVTTVVAMGRSSEGDASTEDILSRQRADSYAMASSLERDIGLARVPAARMAR